MYKPMIIAHRGFSGIYPENTLLSFQKALELGADIMELDVHLSSDGIPMVMHDSNLDRTTNGNGPLVNLPFSELRKLDAGSWKDASFAGEKIPTFDEVLELLKTKSFVHVELKAPGTVQVVVEKIRSHNMEHDVMVTSFHDDLLLETRALAPLIPTLKNIYHHGPVEDKSKLQEIIDLVLIARSNFLAINWTAIDTPKVYEIQKHGIPVILYSPDSKEDILTTLDKHPDGYTTNFPDRGFELTPKY